MISQIISVDIESFFEHKSIFFEKVALILNKVVLHEKNNKGDKK
jgi:hypothetical protein